jgi:SAM-dependent methyltransferase
MWSADRERIIAFYETQLARYGPQDPRSLHWVGTSTQRARFRVLLEVGPWPGRSVADVGSGLGDLYGYLEREGYTLAVTSDEAAPAEAVRYVGYDVTPQMVEAARQNFPQGDFRIRDTVTDGLEFPCDYVLASGTFNVRVHNHRAFFKDAVSAMWQGCTQAVAFNFLGPPLTPGWESPLYYEADPKEMAGFCRTLTPHVIMRDGYLSGDVTLFLYRVAVLCPHCAGRPDSGSEHG